MASILSTIANLNVKKKEFMNNGTVDACALLCKRYSPDVFQKHSQVIMKRLFAISPTKFISTWKYLVYKWGNRRD